MHLVLTGKRILRVAVGVVLRLLGVDEVELGGELVDWLVNLTEVYVPPWSRRCGRRRLPRSQRWVCYELDGTGMSAVVSLQDLLGLVVARGLAVGLDVLLVRLRGLMKSFQMAAICRKR